MVRFYGLCDGKIMVRKTKLGARYLIVSYPCCIRCSYNILPSHAETSKKVKFFEKKSLNYKESI